MPQRGRPPQPGTAEEKAAIRREKVRLYVKAHRERKKNAALATSTSSPESQQSKSTSPPGSDHSLESTNTELSELYKDEDGDEHDDEDDANFVKVERGRTNIKAAASPEEQALVTRSVSYINRARSSITSTPGGNKELAFALLGTFRGQFLPNTVRVPALEEFGSELVTPCSAWITNAYKIAVVQDSGALKSSLLAVGLALTSMQNQDERLKMASLDVYRRALRQVRNDIKPLTTGNATNYLVPYLSCLAAAMFEMVHDGFSENIMQHVKGATSLMELLPRDASVNHLLGDLLLEDLCMWEIVFALKYRYPSPLRALRQQKGARNYKVVGEESATSRNATTLGDLLDCADEISTIMAHVDGLRSQPHSDTKRNALQVELHKLTRILNAFEIWKQRFHNRFGYHFLQVGTDEKEGTPIFQFVSYEVAAAWVYCLTFQLCAIETNIEALSELQDLYVFQTIPSNPTLDTSYTKIVPTIVSTIEVSSNTDSITYQTQPSAETLRPPMRNITKDDTRITLLRKQLRILTTELVEALCVFLPIPKGIIGSSLILFPLDRVKAMLKKEMSRSSEDLANLKSNGLEDEVDVLNDLARLSQSMTIYETLEHTLIQFGMPPMPDD